MIKLENVSKAYGGAPLFQNFTAEFPEHRVSCFLGGSGVGKTTLIHLLAGLVEPDGGRVLVPGDRRISFVFQEPRLLPWYNVYDNLDFVLRDLYSKEQRAEMIGRYLELAGLKEQARQPLSDLSGGMVQRVALCRAFLYPSQLLFLDEPFKGLDAKLKDELLDAFSRIYREDGRTVFFVTHDVEDAARLGDIIYVLSGRPVEIAGTFQRPEIGGFGPELAIRVRELL